MAPGRRRYEIQLTSRTGPIDVFLIQDSPVISNNTAGSAITGLLSSTALDSVPTTDVNDSTLLGGGGGGHEENLLKHFQLPNDPYNFELKPGEGIGDLYGFVDMFGTSADPTITNASTSTSSISMSMGTSTSTTSTSASASTNFNNVKLARK